MLNLDAVLAATTDRRRRHPAKRTGPSRERNPGAATERPERAWPLNREDDDGTTEPSDRLTSEPGA
jgi:hypothetical protein